jgi:hypothetical protein
MPACSSPLEGRQLCPPPDDSTAVIAAATPVCTPHPAPSHSRSFAPWPHPRCARHPPPLPTTPHQRQVFTMVTPAADVAQASGWARLRRTWITLQRWTTCPTACIGASPQPVTNAAAPAATAQHQPACGFTAANHSNHWILTHLMCHQRPAAYHLHRPQGSQRQQNPEVRGLQGGGWERRATRHTTSDLA